MTTPVPVLPVVDDGGGRLEAVVVPVATSIDVDVVHDLAALRRTVLDVRVGDETKRIPVYEDDDGGRWVTYDDALGGS